MARTYLKNVFPLLLIAAIGSAMLTIAPGPSRARRSLAPPAPDLIISEYIEGATPNSSTKAIEIYNGTGGPIDLAASGYTLQIYFSGGVTPSNTISLSFALGPDEAAVIATAPDGDPILPLVDQRTSQLLFNGDDAVALVKAGVIVDIIGQANGTDPGTQWGTAPNDTLDVVLIRKPNVCAGDTNGADPFDPAAEWTGSNWNGTYADLGFHTANCVATDLSISGSVLRANGRGITNAKITVTGGSLAQPIVVYTDRQGRYQVSPLTGSQTYTVAVSHPRYTFNPSSNSIALGPATSVQNVNFIASP